MSYFQKKGEEAWQTLPDPTLHRAIRVYDDQIMMVEMLFDKGAVGAVHSHPHTQATFCLGGEFEFTVGEETQRVKEGGHAVHARRCALWL